MCTCRLVVSHYLKYDPERGRVIICFIVLGWTGSVYSTALRMHGRTAQNISNVRINIHTTNKDKFSREYDMTTQGFIIYLKLGNPWCEEL